MKKMKKIIILLLLSVSYYSCKAQILPRFNNLDFGKTNNAYYKDINNELNPFVGTWMYSTPNDTLKVVFIKKEYFDKETYYADYLVGEFQYVKDGVEKANTLSNLNINHNKIYDYNMFSVTFLKKNSFPKCDVCSLTDKRLSMEFDEPANDDYMLSANFVIRHVVENGVEKLKVQFVMTAGAGGYVKDLNSNATSTSTVHSIPYGEYTLIKQ
jgi:hypothetical protein